MFAFNGKMNNYRLLKIYFGKWVKRTLKILLGANIETRRVIFNMIARKLLKLFKNLINRQHGHIHNPKTLQIVDSISCGGSCKQCIYTVYHHRNKNLSDEVLSRALSESEKIGVTNVQLIGADPFYREDSDNFIKIIGDHRKLICLLFTDGLRITGRHIEQIKKAGNIIPVFNIDGHRQAVDERKGPGSFDKLSAVLDLFKKNKMVFCVSTMVNHINFEEVTSELFLKFIEDKGALLVAYLPYVSPDNEDTQYTISMEEYATLFSKTLKLNRHYKDLIILDLLGNEENISGCAAADRVMALYHDGTVTPCFAIPLGSKNSNFRHLSLEQIYYHDPLFIQIRMEQKRRRESGETFRCMFYHHKWLEETISKNPGSYTNLSPVLFQKRSL